MENHKKVINVFFRLGVDVNAKGEYVSPSLAITASERYEGMARLLIAHEADINATAYDQKNPDGLSVLLVAVSRDYTEVIKILIESGADINVEDGKG
jgi:ankyrin repeat protein